ncbi:MAG: alpha-ketoglutarate-dependent dioxygenase AlkB [Gammaproteobacteria bacterium]|nr:alpha-ketoglutarate-dependent dioxygenase AlkB [Gammaproteobacteria bacterium]MAY03023.1 alpha-ketoglutarate-dependent dioxygenase AlkB [Gammaproteobacteria bacterium]|tara:strand:+ start:651 stop:1298 length:648 start_codon:yes stop_codon:yes gene_type:complete
MTDLFSSAQNEILPLIQNQGELLCLPNWLSREEQGRYFSSFSQELDWKTETLMMAGKAVQSPRLVAWYGDPGARYRYSGLTYTALPWHPLLSELRQRLIQDFETPLNSVLANLYRNGKDSVSWHADSEPELGAEPVIYSLSLGTSRFFDFRRISDHKQKHRIELHSGTLLIMRGPFQHYWQHQVPKQLKIDEPRINLTFRYIHQDAAKLRQDLGN